MLLYYSVYMRNVAPSGPAFDLDLSSQHISPTHLSAMSCSIEGDIELCRGLSYVGGFIDSVGTNAAIVHRRCHPLLQNARSDQATVLVAKQLILFDSKS